MVELKVKRCDAPRRRRTEVVRAIGIAMNNAAVGIKGDVGTMHMIANDILASITSRSAQVVVGRGDFSVNLRFAKKTLTYATARARQGGPLFRVLVFDSLSMMGQNDDGARQLAFQCMAVEGDESENASSSSGKKRNKRAAVASDVDGVPPAIVNAALRVLNDDSIRDDAEETRATTLRDTLTHKFGSFWHVISDEEDFAVANRATELPILDSEDASTKSISMRFKVGKHTYVVWHHVAPYDRFGWGKMTWAEKAKYSRYVLILCGGIAAMYYRTRCNVEVKRGLCRAIPAATPVLAGLFIFLVVSAHVDTRVWNRREKQV